MKMIVIARGTCVGVSTALALWRCVNTFEEGFDERHDVFGE